LDGCNLSVSQERYDPSAFEIANDGAIAMILTPGPIIDADDMERLGRQFRSSPDHPEQGVVADRHSQPLGKVGGRAAAQCQSEMMNDTLQPRCPPGPLSNNPFVKSLSEDPPAAQWRVADEPPCHKSEFDFLAGTGKSTAVLTYRLWIRLDSMPHSGQAYSLAFERAETTRPVSLSVISSTINPAGIKEDKRKLLAMTLILLRNQRYAAIQNHQM
jgi:hypothetical protein